MSKKLLVLAISVLLLGMFVGCDMAVTASAISSRSVSSDSSAVTEKGSKPTSFTVTVTMFQDFNSVVTEQSGNSNHYKTVQETLYSYLDLSAYGLGEYGGLVTSDWSLLNNKLVIMNNTTNYNLDPETTEVSGSNHSVINICDPVTLEVLATIEANGTLSGSLAAGADLKMNWDLTDSGDANIDANGKITGSFVWYDPVYGAANPYYIPNGTFTLTGKYN